MPGQCSTTGVMPARRTASSTAFPYVDTVFTVSPKERVPSPDPEPTSMLGPKFMLNPRAFILVA